MLTKVNSDALSRDLLTESPSAMIRHETTPSLPDARDAAFDRLARLGAADVLILGGGVNGAGTLRDLALNGVSAVLIDSGDFCGGASSASSRMAHGGLRYLEGREFRLVAEAAHERNLLLRQAPHLVHPLEIVVPLRTLTGGFFRAVLRFLGLSRQAGPLSLAALEGALVLYEIFGRLDRTLPRFRTLLRRRRFPAGLARETRAVVSYYDGQILNPEGLVFEILADATRAGDAAALNHMDWTVLPDGAFELRDRETGRSAIVRPKVVINAAGAWIDAVNGRLGLETAYVRGVKGAHLVIRNERLRARMAGRAFYFDDGSGRMVICLPVGETILIGTTEVETRNPDDREVAGDEIGYLLRALGGLFEDIPLGPEDVAAVTTGIRPLQAGGGANATQAARDHAMAENRMPGAAGAPVLSLIGGKWTTFRSFAEHAADRALALLEKPRHVSTRSLSYPGAKPVPPNALAQETGLDEARARALLARYGGVAREVALHCAAGPDRPVEGAPELSLREVEWLIRCRAARTLEDLLLRRTRLVYSGRLAAETVRDLGAILAGTLGRDAEWRAAEIGRALADPRIMGPEAAR